MLAFAKEREGGYGGWAGGCLGGVVGIGGCFCLFGVGTVVGSLVRGGGSDAEDRLVGMGSCLGGAGGLGGTRGWFLHGSGMWMIGFAIGGRGAEVGAEGAEVIVRSVGGWGG